jgi:membrane protein implicated in regulation of membrane protease activity
MSGPTSFDIRIPIGALFAALGAMLTFYGAATISNPAVYSRSLAVNVNLWWGLAMLAFGAGMLAFGLRATRAQRAQGSSASRAGVATEEREHRLGLEREKGLGDSTR